MLPHLLLLRTLPFFFLASCSTIPQITRRNIIEAGSLADSYDYIIVGGGTAGLVLAARVSENMDTTVLVLEAGQNGVEAGDNIARPGFTYYKSLWFTAYDWAFATVPQKNANDRSVRWPQGKVLGGSSAMNGIYLIRPSQADIDAWASVISTMDAEAIKNWQWDSFYPAMKNMEAFSPPTADVATTADIKYNIANHGTQGLIHHSYPGFMLSQVGSWGPTFANLGVPVSDDAYGGKNVGAFVAASAINPTNWTRSYSRSGYLDPLPPRTNLHILTQATVTRIVFDESSPTGDRKATGVEWTTDATGTKKVVNAKKEIILSAGAVGSPHLLLLSGVGPKDVLDASSIKVQAELPGVGQHLQEHLTATFAFDSVGETSGDIRATGSEFSNSPEFLSYVNSAVAFLNISTLFNNDPTAVQTLIDEMKVAKDVSAQSVPSSDSTVLEGYKAIYDATVDSLANSDIGAVELLFSATVARRIQIQVALQHPLSHGRIYINSSSVFDKPLIDPHYLSHASDVAILRQGAKFIRTLSRTEPLASALSTETSPGLDINTDEQFEFFIRNSTSTEFHPTGSCAMLPKEKGGVVDASLKVYGLANVRAIDSSVFPVHLSAHLAEPTYALAELASTFITGVAPAGPNDTNTNSAPSTATSYISILIASALLSSFAP